jgi:S-adenosylmethionine:tRNA ribosyltransferase-isomerase
MRCCGLFVPLRPKLSTLKNNKAMLYIQDYQYDLPDHRIARYPLPERDASKLLVWRDGAIQTDVYRNLDQYLDPGALLVFNNTRVIPARLVLYKPSGGAVELFCLEPQAELATGMTERGESVWKCLVGGAKKWKSGPLFLETPQVRLEVENLGRTQDAYWIRFRWQPENLTFAEVLGEAGQAPLPPYLQRAAETSDLERYQTIYARFDGSVAAPTAGLHFTERLFERLSAKQIETEYVTLHVGAGTFKPVKTETVEDHVMHAEHFNVSAETLRHLRARADRQRVAVGTTSLRTLESLMLMGRKLIADPHLSLEALEVKQWDARNPHWPQATWADALDALLVWLQANGKDRIVAHTQLLLSPGYHIQSIDALATNFHQPGSTLLLLVAALVGDAWKDIYQHALDNDFRFLSYGDGGLLFNKKSLA